MQTYSNVIKTKDVQTTSNKLVNAEVMANTWAIYDAFNEDKPPTIEVEKPKIVDVDIKITPVDAPSSRPSVQGSMVESDYKTSRLSATGSRTLANSQSITHRSQNSSQTIANNEPSLVITEGFLDQLALVERAIVGNSYEKKVIAFRNVPDDGMIETKRVQSLLQPEEVLPEPAKVDDMASTLPTLQLLWTFKCELTRGRQVTYMSWNKQNEDIIAIAYSESRTFAGNPPGLILCWSAKNPEWPDRIYTSSSPVTSVDFSKMNPGLLAAGFMDGRVVIYDVRHNNSKCIMDDSENNGKHRDPVWELKWVERERILGDEQSRNETLVSVSTDGRVTQWMIRKGLEFTGIYS